MSGNQNNETFGKLDYALVKINGKVELLWSYMPLRVDERRPSICVSRSRGRVLKSR